MQAGRCNEHIIAQFKKKKKSTILNVVASPQSDTAWRCRSHRHFRDSTNGNDSNNYSYHFLAWLTMLLVRRRATLQFLISMSESFCIRYTSNCVHKSRCVSHVSKPFPLLLLKSILVQRSPCKSGMYFLRVCYTFF